MEAIDKVYAEDLAVGDVIETDTGRFEEITSVEIEGIDVYVDAEYTDGMVYVWGDRVSIYGYMSVEA